MRFQSIIASVATLGLASATTFAAPTHHKALQHTHHMQALAYHNSASSLLSANAWANRIHLSGIVNVDAKYGSRGPLGIIPLFVMTDDSHELNVNNANLFVDAKMSNCVTAHIGLAYVEDSVNNFDTGLRTAAMFTQLAKQIRSDRGSVFAGGELSVDEAYISVGDFAQSGFYSRFGKMYLPFGTYSNPYSITVSLPQLFSQTRATGAELGYVSATGWYANLFILDGGQSSQNFADEKFDKDFAGGLGIVNENIPFTRINNYGVKVGFHGHLDCFDFHVNGAFIKDIRDASFLTDIQGLAAFTDKMMPPVLLIQDDEGELEFEIVEELAVVEPSRGFGMRQTGGISLHGDVVVGQWQFGVDYVAALKNMIRQRNSGQSHTSTKIWASDINATYHSHFMGYPSWATLSYQRTGQAAGVAPKIRYVGQVSAEVYPHTFLTFEFTHNRDYDRSEDDFCHFINSIVANNAPGKVCGGTGRSSSQATLRLGVQF